jgi:tRNA dimethylallyltransferase
LICIAGPTAVGKTEFSLSLAEALDGEIVNADSRQLYRNMDIGTAKPTAAERARVPHHLIDELNPGEPFSVGMFVKRADAAIADIKSRGKLPIVVGGTGLYIRALVDGLWDGPTADAPLRAALEGIADRQGRGELHRILARLDPASAKSLHPNDLYKVMRALEITFLCGRPASVERAEHGFPGRYKATMLALTRPRHELHRRIEQRVDAMLNGGWVEETKALLAAGVSVNDPGMNALGYREIARVLAGEWSLKEAREAICTASRRYAKRQFTWFRKDARLQWLEMSGVSVPDLVTRVSNANK